MLPFISDNTLTFYIKIVSSQSTIGSATADENKRHRLPTQFIMIMGALLVLVQYEWYRA